SQLDRNRASDTRCRPGHERPVALKIIVVRRGHHPSRADRDPPDVPYASSARLSFQPPAVPVLFRPPPQVRPRSPACFMELALWGTYARMTWASDYEIGIPRRELDAAAAHLEPGWGTGVGLAAWAPSVAHDPNVRENFGRIQRLAASPGAAMELMTSLADIDV